jgi:hypothetical protein
MIATDASRFVQIPRGCNSHDVSVVVARLEREERRRQAKMISLWIFISHAICIYIGWSSGVVKLRQKLEWVKVFGY